MSKSEVETRSRPATYRELRQVVSKRLLLREAFDEWIEREGISKKIASLWVTHYLLLARELVKKSARQAPTPDEFEKLENAIEYIKKRLPDRLYYAVILTVMEAMPAGLGQEVPVTVIEQWEKLTAVLGRKDAWLPKKGRKRNAKTRRSESAEAEQENNRLNQVLNAIGEISRETSFDLAPLKKKDVAQRIGVNPKTLRRWIEMYVWDWDVLEVEGARGHE